MMQQQMISMDNYEEFFFLGADGELDEAQQQALQRFLQQHPELETELKEVTSLKLVPDEGLVFEDKKSLLKREEKKRVIDLSNPWKAFAAAASIGLLIWAGMRLNQSGRSASVGAMLASIAAVPSIQSPTPAPQKMPPPMVENSGSPALAAAPRLKHPVKTNQPQKELPLPEKAAASDVLQLTALQSARHAATAVNAGATVVPKMIEMPAPVAYQSSLNDAPARSGLHFSTENIAAIQVLKNAATATIDRINNSPYHLRDVALSVRVGGKTLSINF